MKDKKACIFYFLMTIVFLDFGNQLRKISHIPYIQNTGYQCRLREFFLNPVHRDGRAA